MNTNQKAGNICRPRFHLKNIYEGGELIKEATTEKFSVVQIEGSREVNRQTLFYNLDAIISVGYRINSVRATQFRQWCTAVLRHFAIRGYVIDKKRMENGQKKPRRMLRQSLRNTAPSKTVFPFPISTASTTAYFLCEPGSTCFHPVFKYLRRNRVDTRLRRRISF